MNIEFSSLRGNYDRFERSGRIKDVFEQAGSDIIVKKFVDEGDKERKIKLGNFFYTATPYQWFDDEPAPGTVEFTNNRKREYEVLRKYLGEVVLESSYLIAEDENGRVSTFEVQEKVKGKTLSQLNDSDRGYCKEQLKEFAKNALEMFDQIGWLPDIHEDLAHTDNMIVDESGAIHFVDNDAIYILPEEIFRKYQGRLFDKDGINRGVVEELEKLKVDSRYATNISQTVESLVSYAG